MQVTGTPGLAGIAWDLVLAAGPDPYQPGPVTGQLPELADLGRGGPRLGQPAHLQQISQVSSAFLIVLDPPAAAGVRLTGCPCARRSRGIGASVDTPQASSCFSWDGGRVWVRRRQRGG